MNKLVVTLLLTPTVLAAVSGCTSSSSSFSQPKESAFNAGSCRQLAPAVLQLGRDVNDLGTKTPSVSQRTTLKDDQQKVRDLQTGLSAGVAPAVQNLVYAVGLLRIRADTNSYDGTLAGLALEQYKALVALCTSPAASPS